MGMAVASTQDRVERDEENGETGTPLPCERSERNSSRGSDEFGVPEGRPFREGGVGGLGRPVKCGGSAIRFQDAGTPLARNSTLS
jgi:hypothetical protein